MASLSNHPGLARETAAQDRARHDDLRVEEQLARQKLERSMWRRMIPLLGPVRGRIAAVALVETVLVGFVFLRPWLIRNMIDRGLARAGDTWSWSPRIVGAMAVLLAVCWVARFALAALSQYLAGTAALTVLA